MSDGILPDVRLIDSCCNSLADNLHIFIQYTSKSRRRVPCLRSIERQRLFASCRTSIFLSTNFCSDPDCGDDPADAAVCH